MRKVLLRRGNFKDMPELAIGEVVLCEDEDINEIFIGTKNGPMSLKEFSVLLKELYLRPANDKSGIFMNKLLASPEIIRLIESLED